MKTFLCYFAGPDFWHDMFLTSSVKFLYRESTVAIHGFSNPYQQTFSFHPRWRTVRSSLLIHTIIIFKCLHCITVDFIFSAFSSRLARGSPLGISFKKNKPAIYPVLYCPVINSDSTSDSEWNGGKCPSCCTTSPTSHRLKDSQFFLDMPHNFWKRFLSMKSSCALNSSL